MAEKLHQVSIDYNPTEDRILLRVSTSGQKAYYVWMTRRFTFLLRNLLRKNLLEGVEVASPEAKEAMLEWQKREVLEKADFSKPYEVKEEFEYPLGASGIVASTLAIQPIGQNLQVKMAPPQGQGIDLTLDRNLLQIFIKMIDDAVAKADWNLAPALSSGETAEGKVH